APRRVPQTTESPRAQSLEYATPARASVDFSDLDLRPFETRSIQPPRSQGVRMAVVFGVCIGCLGWYALLHSEDLKSLFPARPASSVAPAPIVATTLPPIAQPMIDSRPAVAVLRSESASTGSNATPWRAIGSTGTSQPASLSTGRLIVDSHPVGATVFLDGEAVGQTPAVIPEVGVGSHTIRLALDNHHDWLSPVKVFPGEQNRVTASLEEEPPPQ
ncbi:MAG TPA: PEGA domain-containing protein, partial [Vicinamibacterales bacterium]|nr:PEGA domain-containing protein [Vicinamibacterales bacterium]